MKAAGDDILSIPTIVLANLCVCHIMTSENEKAEELIQMTEEVSGHTKFVVFLLPSFKKFCFEEYTIQTGIATLIFVRIFLEFSWNFPIIINKPLTYVTSHV